MVSYSLVRSIGGSGRNRRSRPVPANVKRSFLEYMMADTYMNWGGDQTVDVPGVVLERIIGESPAVVGLRRMISVAARTTAPVLVMGETGSGKELVAEVLHAASGRTGPLVAVNCAAIPRDIMEAELFGYEKGAFTGASARCIGRIEAAAGGTLFLDEIGEMPVELQSKLLRVLENRRIRRLGGNEEIEADVRIVSATNVDIEAAVRAGQFREDLLYRLDVLRIAVPRLADRCDDIPRLLEAFADGRHGDGAPPPRFAPDAIKALKGHPWPGNVRELRNVFERVQAFYPGETIGARQVREMLSRAGAPDPSSAGELACDASSLLDQDESFSLRRHVQKVEEAFIRAALSRSDHNTAAAARHLGLQRTTLVEKMRKIGI